MSNYIKIQNLEYPVSYHEVIASHPNTSFPTVDDDVDLSDFGFQKVIEATKPSFDPIAQDLVEGTPILINGKYHQVWNITDLAAEDISANQASAVVSLIDSITSEAQRRLDDFAKTRIYDNVNSIGKYKDITDAEIATLPVQEQPIVARYRSECRYLALATSRTWAILELIKNDVVSGVRAIPNNFSEIEGELPALEWP